MAISRINESITIPRSQWLVSKIVANGHTIIVFEGVEPYDSSKTWLWACDFVPAKYRYNDQFAGENICNLYGVTMENLVGTAGVVRTSYPYGDHADREDKYYQLSERHFSGRSRFKSKSWLISPRVGLRVHKEINRQEKDPPMYQTLGDKSIVSDGLRTWCSFFGEERKTGFNCESWVNNILEQCGLREVRSCFEVICSIPGCR